MTTSGGGLVIVARFGLAVCFTAVLPSFLKKTARVPVLISLRSRDISDPEYLVDLLDEQA